MIKEYEYLHGVVFTRLCSIYGFNVSIKPFKNDGYSSYVINDKAGLYIKYCGKRLTPWRFSFAKSHQNEIEEMHMAYGEVFVALVCYLDGVVMLSYAELKKILDTLHDEHEWISVSRPKNKMYCVAASDGELDFKVGKTSCPDKVKEYFRVI